MEKKVKAVTILLRATKSLERVLKDDIEGYGLNTTEFGVLEFLYHKGPQPMNNLCNKLLMANSSMTYVVDNLIKRNFVNKYIDDADKRSNFVELTSEGEEFIKKIFPTHEERINEVFSLLNDNELDNLLESLKKVGYYAESLIYKKR